MWNWIPIFLNSDPSCWTNISQYTSDPARCYWGTCRSFLLLVNKDEPHTSIAKWHSLSSLFRPMYTGIISDFPSHSLGQIHVFQDSCPPWACLPLSGSGEPISLCPFLSNFLPLQVLQGLTQMCFNSPKAPAALRTSHRILPVPW